MKEGGAGSLYVLLHVFVYIHMYLGSVPVAVGGVPGAWVS